MAKVCERYLKTNQLNVVKISVSNHDCVSDSVSDSVRDYVSVQVNYVIKLTYSKKD